jgi:hypothetical protein
MAWVAEVYKHVDALEISLQTLHVQTLFFAARIG